MGRKEKAEVFQLLTSFLADINSEPDTSLLVVEGKKDARALRMIGVTKPVYCLCGKNFDSVINDLIRYKKVILLLDFDCEGTKIKLKLIRELQGIGVNIDLNYAKRIRKISKGRVNVIEGLNTFLENALS